MIFTYYARLPEGENVALANAQCTFTRVVYVVWLSVCFIVSCFRIMGFSLMYRARKFLISKLREKERRKIYRREKKKKEKRKYKRALQNMIAEKQGIQMALQQRIMKNLRRINDMEPDD